MRHVSYLILLAALNSCGSGPSVTYCVPDEEGYACSDGKVHPHVEMHNWACLEAMHIDTLLRFCNEGVVAKVLWCPVLEGGREVVCQRDPAKEPVIIPVDNDNQGWACLSPMDTKRLLYWCGRSRG